MIGRVREMLRFQAKAVTLFIDVPVLPGNRSVQKVARVKLHSRLGGQDLQHSSAGGFVHQGGASEAVVLAMDYPVVIIAASQHQLFVVLIDALADRSGLGEVHGSALDRSQLAGWDQGLVHGSKAVRIEQEMVPQNVAVALTRQVEIGMLGKIQRRGLVGGSFVIHDQLVVVGQSIGDFDFEVAGISFLAVFAQIAVSNSDTLSVLELLGLPELFVKPVGSAMQGVRAVIFGQGIFHAVEGEGGVGNPVGVAPDDGAEVGGVLQISVNFVVTEDNVAQVAVLVRHSQRHDDAAVVDGAYFEAL